MKPVTIAIAVLLLSGTSAFAVGDIDKGKKLFKKCKACHMVGENAKKRVGPILNNIFGATAGTSEGYTKYSKNMKKAGEEGLIWTEETLTEFLTKPKAMIKKTRMSFKGIKKEKDMVNIIAYLATFSPDYSPEEMEDKVEEKADENMEEKSETKTDG